MLLKQESRERAKLDGVLYWQDWNDQSKTKNKKTNPLVNDEEKNNNQPIKTSHTEGCLLICRLKPDRGLNPESAHTQPAHSLTHIFYNIH